MNISGEDYDNIQDFEEGDMFDLTEDSEVLDNQTFFEDFDDSLSDMDFSDATGDFKKSFRSVNRKMDKKQAEKKNKRFIQKKSKNRRKAPITAEYYVKKKATILGRNQKKISKVIVPRDRKVIVEGVSRFILSKSADDDSVRNIGYYKGKKLQELVLIFNNDSASDFVVNIFDPSMPLNYFYSTSLNLNDKITVAGGAVSYSDVLFNLLANPAMMVNAKFVFAAPTPTLLLQQTAIPIRVSNKTIAGTQEISPLNLSLQIDNMQVANDIVVFDMMKATGKPFIPNGMETIQYTVLEGNTVTMSFFYTQVSLKKFFFEEARRKKRLI